jgi:Family of unknown function (DUF6492)
MPIVLGYDAPMTELAVITPCYRGDAELFRELHRSVLEFTSPDTVHHVFVPPQDIDIFREYEGPRCNVTVRSEMLPSHYFRVPRSEVYVNLKRPWPALRPWVMQQTVKIAAAAQLDADVVLLADSDAILVRPTSAGAFRVGGRADGRLALHREEKAVSAEMTRHVIWHQVARTLFGLPPAPPPPLPDYVTALNFWEPAVVRAMQQRITETTGRDWMDVFNAQLHVSEFMLYGVFVDEVLSAKGPRPAAAGVICQNYYERTPMTPEQAVAFADRLAPETVAIMISSHSGTTEEVRQLAIQRCREKYNI